MLIGLNKKDKNKEEKMENNINKNDSYLSKDDYSQGVHSLSEIIINLNEMDRKRIARELHDSTIQNMVCMIHKVELASRFIDTDPIRVKLELSTMKKLLKENIDELRSLVYDLRPMSFDDLGFDILLKQYLDELDQLYDNEIEYHYDADLSDVKENSLIWPIFLLTTLALSSGPTGDCSDGILGIFNIIKSKSACLAFNSSCKTLNSSPKALLFAIIAGRSSAEADLIEALNLFFSSAKDCDEVFNLLISLCNESKAFKSKTSFV